MRPDDKLTAIKGVGEVGAKLFGRLGINTVRDLLFYLPRDYEDRSQVKDIADLCEDDETSIQARIGTAVSSYKVHGRMSYSRTKVLDKTGILDITWFNMPYLSAKLSTNESYIFFGKVRRGKNGKLEMLNPVFEKCDNDSKRTRRLVPIYPLTAKLTQVKFQDVIYKCLEQMDEKMDETLPEYLIEKYNLLDLDTSIRSIHMPENLEMFERARKRLVFEEFLFLQLGLGIMRTKKDSAVCQPFRNIKCVAEFADSLDFTLTNAQKRVINEICTDLRTDKPMNRLVQGDVGSGKTIVAAAAMYAAVQSGFQACMMVPTEILAEQHYHNLSKLFKKFDINVSYLSSGLAYRQKSETLEEIKWGSAHIVIGTHALIADKVEFQNLGLIITDEQHRFGVKQRAGLASKADNAHTLIMTATPIPRTLGLVLYGDIDISVINELPPGRKKVETYAVDEKMRSRINEFIKKHLDEGRQAYIVCPLIEDSDISDLKAATQYAEKLKNGAFKNYKIEVMSGKIKGDERERIMRQFMNGKIDILVSTTVIEVGVDVPNATIMVIENAERFGLSQLHQLRGRVGRGEYQSYCIMFSQATRDVTRERMTVMTQTNDGFKIAEKDLELRGPGEFFGTRQHGLPELKVANLFSDMDVLTETQKAAYEIIENDPDLLQDEHKNIKIKIENMFDSIGGEGLIN